MKHTDKSQQIQATASKTFCSSISLTPNFWPSGHQEDASEYLTWEEVFQQTTINRSSRTITQPHTSPAPPPSNLQQQEITIPIPSMALQIPNHRSNSNRPHQPRFNSRPSTRPCFPWGGPVGCTNRRPLWTWSACYHCHRRTVIAGRTLWGSVGTLMQMIVKS